MAERNRPVIPPELSAVYPNPPVEVFGTPTVVFRDHRWTLPVLALAAEHGLIRLPAVMIAFDRHRDALVPERGLDALSYWRNKRGCASRLADIVANLLSPRDDDWIVAGMQAGLLSDVVQFRSEDDDLEPVTRYTDSTGAGHRIYHLGTFGRELSFKGALADEEHPAVVAGLWRNLGWNPRTLTAGGWRSVAVDIDLDCFSAPWGTYVIPFTREIWRGEFLSPRSSHHADNILPASVFEGLVRAAGVVTVASEPDFCAGAAGARKIFGEADRFLFGGAFGGKKIRLDYRPVYPSDGPVRDLLARKRRKRE